MMKKKYMVQLKEKKKKENNKVEIIKGKSY